MQPYRLQFLVPRPALQLFQGMGKELCSFVNKKKYIQSKFYMSNDWLSRYYKFYYINFTNWCIAHKIVSIIFIVTVICKFIVIALAFFILDLKNFE